MPWIVKNLWLIPALPILAAGLSSVVKQRQRKFSASLAIGSIGLSLLLSLCAFAHAVALWREGGPREFFNVRWFQFGEECVKLGWVLDPLGAVMLVMVSFVGLLIFIYSLGYMQHDKNAGRFFCFLSLFAGAMLGVVIANSLLLLFMCWELVGLTSYLLIGFWYHKPAAAAAAKKAFITTRIGDIAFLLGMVWLYEQAGTLVFYDGGNGCLEQSFLVQLVTRGTGIGIAVSTGIGLLLFCGAAGKSGQVPFHVWLPDAMEGPTPVSALIHAATMVAAGVFLVARVYPLMAAHADGAAAATTALQAVTWVGAITALFAASIAVAQTDIKRILAYSTVSQLGYMMIGLGAGGIAVGMFHLITHAFFKALLFLGAGSVIHGCKDEQDIRRMGGLRRFMPVTFATYAVGMLALSGFPLLFSGFWSKDAILHAAQHWSVSSWPFLLGILGAFLTAFYMTRQVAFVFFGNCQLKPGGPSESEQRTLEHGGIAESAAGEDLRGPDWSVRGGDGHRQDEGHGAQGGQDDGARLPHESPWVMTGPLVILAVCSIGLGFLGTPYWPWFQRFLGGEAPVEGGMAALMISSSALVLAGIGVGWWLYGRTPPASCDVPDPLEKLPADAFRILRNKFWIDEIYEHSIVAFNAWWAWFCDWLDRWIWGGAVRLISFAVLGISWLDRFCDEFLVNLGFDAACREVRRGAKGVSRFQDGQVQSYLRMIGVGLIALALLAIWGCVK